MANFGGNGEPTLPSGSSTGANSDLAAINSGMLSIAVS